MMEITNKIIVVAVRNFKTCFITSTPTDCSLYEICNGQGTALLIGRSRDRFPVLSLDFFSWLPPTEPRDPRSTQPLKLCTRGFSWGKGRRCVPSYCRTSRKSGALIYPKNLGPPRPVAGWPLPFTFTYEICMGLVKVSSIILWNLGLSMTTSTK